MKTYKPKRTDKQRQIVHLILTAADEGTFYTVKELHEALPYTCAYGSLRTSLRFLRERKIIELERSGQVKFVRPLPAAYDWFRLGR